MIITRSVMGVTAMLSYLLLASAVGGTGIAFFFSHSNSTVRLCVKYRGFLVIILPKELIAG